MPKISIITVNLNNLEGLKKTAESVFNQSFKDFEFIVIDGNSTDGSKEYITKISTNLTHWISESDTGIYNAMNKGIRLAKGDYVYFLNSGDIFYATSTLEEVADKMQANLDLYYGDLIYNWSNKQEVISFPKTLSFIFFIADNINHQACFIKKSLFNDISYYNENYKIISDWEFLIYAVCKKEISYKHLDMLISIYDTLGISTDIKNRKAIIADKKEVIQKYFPLFAYNYEEISGLSTKRVKQFFYIRKHKVAFRFLKWFMSFLLIFLPKKDHKSKYTD